MILEKIDIMVYKNSNTELRGQVFNSDGNIFPIPGATFKLTVKERPFHADNDALIIKTSAGGDFLIIDSDTGKYKVEITPTDLEDVNPGAYVYDVQLTQPDGKKFTIQQGFFSVIRAVTAS